MPRGWDLDTGEPVTIPGQETENGNRFAGGAPGNLAAAEQLSACALTEPRTRQPTRPSPDQARTTKRIVGQYSGARLDYNNGALGGCIGRSARDA